MIHHSDRGLQYASEAYTARLFNFFPKIPKKEGVKPQAIIEMSMTQNSDPYENALAERMNRTIKEEMLNNKVFETIGQARRAIATAIKEYNEVRPHLSLDFLTPDKAHKMTGDIPKRWKKYPFKVKNDYAVLSLAAATQAHTAP